MTYTLSHMTLRWTLLLLCIGSFSPLFGQEEGLPASEVEVLKEFRAQLAEVEDIQLAVPLRPQKDTARAYLSDYKLSMPRLSLTDQPVELDASTPEEEIADLHSYDGYFDLGYGLNQARRVHAGYSRAFSDNVTLDAAVRYDGFNANDPSWLTKDDVDAVLSADVQLRNWLVTPEVHYSYQNYGLNTEDFPSIFIDDEMKFNSSAVRLSAENAEPIWWDLHVKGDYTFRYSDHDLDWSTRDHEFNIAASKRDLIDGLELILSGQYQSNNSSSTRRPSTIDNFLPQIDGHYTLDRWHVHLGSGYLFSDVEDAWLPSATVSYAIHSSTLLHGGLLSSVSYPTLDAIIDMNPYTRTFAPGIPMVERRYFIEGHTVVQDVHLGLNLSYADNDQMPLFWLPAFSQDLSLRNRFETISADADRYQVTLNAHKEVLDGLTTELELVYDMVRVKDSLFISEDLGSLDRDNIQFVLRGQYAELLDSRLTIGAAIEGIHGSFAGQGFSSSPENNTYITMHLDAAYAIWNDLGVYVHVHNLLDDRSPMFMSVARLGITPSIGLRGRF